MITKFYFNFSKDYNNLWCEEVLFNFRCNKFKKLYLIDFLSIYAPLQHPRHAKKVFLDSFEPEFQKQCENLGLNGTLFYFFDRPPYRLELNFETKEQAEYFYLIQKINPLMLYE